MSDRPDLDAQGSNQPGNNNPGSDQPVGNQPSSDPLGPRPSHGGQHREVLRLAIPAFLALVAEPLFLLTDAAIV
ncbi:MAG: hypothetical protein KA249_09530, partial [Dermatophilaceae bacterium]|nr:hypothetical protein [Dermatophilaceae bacterium]